MSGTTALNRGAIDRANFSTRDILFGDKIAGFELFSAEISLIQAKTQAFSGLDAHISRLQR